MWHPGEQLQLGYTKTLYF
ncbi:hypothetical protein Gorai_012520 [Gossypium raimondii]|uniref:Uncharacterized protein n=1 Tax=Gossypium raimondii TaxID=29730 RepID=A0A7J8Q2A4_GOSRA|nr:hypothetical protein [Gossypium raimondii]